MKKYRNVSAETLSSRNPRITVEPGEVVDLSEVSISQVIRNWVRSGSLLLEPDEPPKGKSKAKAKPKAVS